MARSLAGRGDQGNGVEVDDGRSETLQRGDGDVFGLELLLVGEPCDVAVVVGTTAAFSYVIDWALRSAGETGELIEVNPDETPLSRFASRTIREPAAMALPKLVDSILA